MIEAVPEDARPVGVRMILAEALWVCGDLPGATRALAAARRRDRPPAGGHPRCPAGWPRCTTRADGSSRPSRCWTEPMPARPTPRPSTGWPRGCTSSARVGRSEVAVAGGRRGARAGRLDGRPAGADVGPPGDGARQLGRAQGGAPRAGAARGDGRRGRGRRGPDPREPLLPAARDGPLRAGRPRRPGRAAGSRRRRRDRPPRRRVAQPGRGAHVPGGVRRGRAGTSTGPSRCVGASASAARPSACSAWPRSTASRAATTGPVPATRRPSTWRGGRVRRRCWCRRWPAWPGCMRSGTTSRAVGSTGRERPPRRRWPWPSGGLRPFALTAAGWVALCGDDRARGCRAGALLRRGRS